MVGSGVRKRSSEGTEDHSLAWSKMERPQKGQRPRDGQDEAVKSGPRKSWWRGTEVRPWRRGDSSEYPVNQGVKEGRLHVLFAGRGAMESPGRGQGRGRRVMW